MVLEFKSQLQPEYLENLVNSQKDYSQAKPFPHIIADNFLPEAILNRVLEEFPNPRTIDWKTFDNSAEKKLASTSELQMEKILACYYSSLILAPLLVS